MPDQQTAFNSFILVKFVLWVVVIVIATILLRRHKVTRKVRLAFLIGGTFQQIYLWLGLWVGSAARPITPCTTA